VSGPLGLTGWVLACGGFVAAMIASRRLTSRMEVVARACHELRGPLTAARLGLELGSRVRELPRARLRAIELELVRATLAVEDLSAAWQRRRGGGEQVAGLELRREAFDVAELLADSVEAWRAPAAAREIELRFIGAMDRALVVGNRLRLAQASGNLIANALEHGGGAVEVSVGRQGENVRIEIADEGPGLPASVAQLVARRRSGPALGRATLPARGHGLAVASEVAQAHGGRLAAAPSERGARLVIDLPALVAARSEVSG